MSPSFRKAAIHIALAAMLLRAMLPVGWMPSSAPGTWLTICSGDAGVLGGHGKPSPADSSQHSHEECPFAAAPVLAAPGAQAVLAAPAYVTAMVQTLAPPAGPARSGRYQPQSPRAPPLTA